MSDITILDDVYVELIDKMGDDDSIIQAMLVSTRGENNPDPDPVRDLGRINFLMRDHHGSPFEHAVLKVYVKAPIFVFREWHRHRIASYNEMSGRYKELPGNMYIPKPTRPLTQVGKPGAYTFVPGTEEQYGIMTSMLMATYRTAWMAYQEMLGAGIAREVARIALPVGLYSEMYCTMNLRAIMNFLSLRTFDPTATFPSHPQHEIELGAQVLEKIFQDNFPLVHAAWHTNGRVAP